MNTRRLPVYILIDTSGSMRGEPIESVKVGLEDMIATLRQDPYALDTVWISIITYNMEAKQVLPLTELSKLQLPDIVVPDSGATFTGEALELLNNSRKKEIRTTTKSRKGDWMPLLFLLTDGTPSDLQKYKRMIPEIKSASFGNIVACAVGPKAKTEFLEMLTDNVYTLDTMDKTTFKKFFEWVSESINEGGRSGVNNGEELEAPPTNLDITIN